MRSRTIRIVTVTAALVAAAAVGAGGGAATFAALGSDGGSTTVRQVTVESSEPVASTTDSLSVSEVYEHAYKSVVEITTTLDQPSPTGGEQPASGQGSGFVFDAEGHVVTNHHVVDGAQSVSVRLWDGSTYDATVVGSDPSTDLAVIKVDAPADVLIPLALGDSASLSVGESVVALGSPFGLEGTLTSGIVSALNREMTSPNNFTISNSIQTDAAINHGNSGGPLLNAAGEVVGVNTQIKSESGGNDGIGFAVPSSTVSSIVPHDHLQRVGGARLPRRRRRLPLRVGRHRARRACRRHGHRGARGHAGGRGRPARRLRLRDGRRPELSRPAAT